MSAAHRGTKRRVRDAYPTPAWCTELLLEAGPSIVRTASRVIDPFAGDGAILRVLGRTGAALYGVEVRKRPMPRLESSAHHVFEADMFKESTISRVMEEWGSFEVVVTNPPYSKLMPAIEVSLRLAPVAIMLLRVGAICSKARYDFMASHIPDDYRLPRRPSFVDGKSREDTVAGKTVKKRTKKGQTDACEYSWYVFYREERTSGVLKLLPYRDLPKKGNDVNS